MLIALTGTPGTGKTAAAKYLNEQNYRIIDLQKLCIEQDFIIDKDLKRNSFIVDLEKADLYIKENYISDDINIIDSHLSHLLKSVDKVLILRCHPKVLRERLNIKKWKKEKYRENIEAEILDVILCEAVEIHSKINIFEINTSNLTIEQVGSSILEIINKNFQMIKKYNIGNIDWSEEIFKDFQMDGLN